MNPDPKLFMLLIGCTPPGRHTEQHDVLFAIGETLKDLTEQINSFWPEAIGRIHIDAWREVTSVNGYQVSVINKTLGMPGSANKLFFINLGGYIQDVFDEQHYMMLSVNPDSASAIKTAKETLFYQQTSIPGGESHIDDKYGIDVDDFHNVEDILPFDQKEKYAIKITLADNLPEDEIHLGYFTLSKLAG